MQGTFFIVIQLVLLYGTCSLRPVSLAFVIERTVATIKSKGYEKKSYWWIVVILLVVIITENIRAMNAIHPLLLGIIIFNLISMGYSMISVPTGFLQKYITLIFYTVNRQFRNLL
uniref:Uncharacterized protein n=1 Tax=Acrobeloides nanus TaxID=290746 RepID=A0A914EMV4_9BILA